MKISKQELKQIIKHALHEEAQDYRKDVVGEYDVPMPQSVRLGTVNAIFSTGLNFEDLRDALRRMRNRIQVDPYIEFSGNSMLVKYVDGAKGYYEIAIDPDGWIYGHLLAR